MAVLWVLLGLAVVYFAFAALGAVLSGAAEAAGAMVGQFQAGLRWLIERLTGAAPVHSGAALGEVSGLVAPDWESDDIGRKLTRYAPWSENYSRFPIEVTAPEPRDDEYAPAAPAYQSQLKQEVVFEFPTSAEAAFVKELLQPGTVPIVVAVQKQIVQARRVAPPRGLDGPRKPVQPPLAPDFELAEPVLTLPLDSKPKAIRWLQELAYAADLRKFRTLHAAWARKRAEALDLHDRRQKAYSRAHLAYSAAQAQHERKLAKGAAGHAAALIEYERTRAAEEATFRAATEPYLKGSHLPDEVQRFFLTTLNNLALHPDVALPGSIAYEQGSRTVVAEIRLPHLPTITFGRQPRQFGGPLVALPQKQQKTLRLDLLCALMLRCAHELARCDLPRWISNFVLNGRVEYRDAATGQHAIACAATLQAPGDELRGLDLEHVEPVAAFEALRGRSVGESYTVSPVVPLLQFDENDSRFIQGRDVLKTDSGVNLASMPWDDFEHLVRQLFQLEYAAVGAKVEITRASRDRGVDAVVHDPDPLRGGKFIVQAKRYVNRVDVSAVRDLYGTLIAEGAARAILVTTSHFGPDSKEFAAGKPLTLLEGPQLLGLLERHGFRYRIDLAEARAQMGAGAP
jgi:restriction system protein